MDLIKDFYMLYLNFSLQYNIKVSIGCLSGYGPNASDNENKEHALNGMILRMVIKKKKIKVL